MGFSFLWLNCRFMVKIIFQSIDTIMLLWIIDLYVCSKYVRFYFCHRSFKSFKRFQSYLKQFICVHWESLRVVLISKFYMCLECLRRIWGLLTKFRDAKIILIKVKYQIQVLWQLKKKKLWSSFCTRIESAHRQQ